MEELTQFEWAKTAVEVAELQLAEQDAPDRGDFVWPLDVVSLEASFPQELQLRKAAHFDGLGVVRHAWHCCVLAVEP